VIPYKSGGKEEKSGISNECDSQKEGVMYLNGQAASNQNSTLPCEAVLACAFRNDIPLPIPQRQSHLP